MSLLFFFCFFIVFMYQILENVMVSNVFYYAILLKNLVTSKRLGVRRDIVTKIYLLFFLWVLISTLIFSISVQEVSIRNLAQLFFTIQYFIFVVDFKMDVRKFEKWLVSNYVRNFHRVSKWFKPPGGSPKFVQG